MIEAILAADIYLTLGGWSEHGEKKYSDYGIYREYNKSHEAIILDYEGLTIGTFKNSYHARTNLIGYTYRYNDFSITGAYGSGYREIPNTCHIAIGNECLLITASYSFEPFKLSLMGDALAFAFEIKL